MESKYFFRSKQNKIERSILKHIQETFFALFVDDPNEVRFKANSIRRYCERRWKSFIVKVPEGVTKAHLAQTAHNMTTAEDIYIGRGGTSQGRDQLLVVNILGRFCHQRTKSRWSQWSRRIRQRLWCIWLWAAEEQYPIDPQTLLETPLLSSNEPIVRQFNVIRPSVDIVTPMNTVRERPAANATEEHPAVNTVTANAVQNRESLNST